MSVPRIHQLACVDSTVKIGAGTVIHQFATVVRGARLGKNCSVSPGAVFDGSHAGDRVRIGINAAMGPGFLIEDDVFIGPNVTLANDAWPRAHKHGFNPEAFDGSRYAVIVKRGASIGANSVILPGVVIGRDAMVAAGSVVTTNVPERHLWCASDVRPIEKEPQRMRFACEA